MIKLFLSSVTLLNYSFLPQHHQNKTQNQHRLPTTTNTACRRHLTPLADDNQHRLPTTSNIKRHNRQIKISQIWLADNLRQNMNLSLKLIICDGKLCHTNEGNRLWARRLTLSDMTSNDWFIYLRWCSFFCNLRDLPTLEYLVKFWGRKVKVKYQVFFHF